MLLLRRFMKKIILATIFLLYISISESNAQVRYDLYCNNRLLKKSEQIMLTQVGIIEKTNRNDGEVEKYLHCIGSKRGQPYCAAGQYWCFAQAAKELNLSKEKIPIPATGLVYNIYKFAQKYGRRKKYVPEKHCLIIWQYPNKRRGHIERIIKVENGGWVETVGFNTSADKQSSQRDGQGVFKKRRNIFHPLQRMEIKCLLGFYGDRKC